VTVRRGTESGRAEDYWCYVRPGTYRVGGWADGQEAADIMLGAFWIGRFPITVAQFRAFATEGYGAGAERWWSPQGWAWRLKSACTEPRHWDEPQYTGGSQPVVGVSWYEAAAYCAWLSEVLRNILPAGRIVRLPTEAEWEAAAAFDGAGLRRRHPWGQIAPTLNHAISSEAGQTAAAPVGCCPAGAAASGALDMLGNVEEWCASWYGDYPRRSGRVVSDPPAGRGVLLGPLGSRQLPVRGGWWAQRPEQLWCGHRFWHEASAASSTTGFRIVLAAPNSEGALPQERSE
jgi:formylglycine-generating enzyme required for sulfatase activity